MAAGFGMVYLLMRRRRTLPTGTEGASIPGGAPCSTQFAKAMTELLMVWALSIKNYAEL